jgi:hypothetical protein
LILCVFNKYKHLYTKTIQKRREFNLETHILFVDYIKAFDRLHHRKLWDITTEKGCPEHMIGIIKYMYEGIAISTDKGMHISQKMGMINQGVRQSCLLLPTLFSVCLDAAACEWGMQLKSHFSLGTMILDILLFADDQVIFTKSEAELQMATLQLSNIMAAHNFKISYDKTKIMAFHCKYQIRSKIILNKKP